MWQRYGHKQPTISNPMYFTELDYDDGYGHGYGYGYEDRYLETIPEVDSISSRRQSVQLELPDLPFRVMPPLTGIPQPVNVNSYQPATSSTARPTGQGLRIDVPHEQVMGEDISPLSPQTLPEHSQDEPPVSPIYAIRRTQARAPLPEQPFQSHIPRKVTKNQGNEEKVQTRWDSFSGEPIQEDAGKLSSVRPGSQPVEMQYPHLKERTRQILAGLREREAAKKKTPNKVSPPVLDGPRDDQPQSEPRKNASGRAATVETIETVKTTPVAQHNPTQLPELDINCMSALYSPAEVSTAYHSSPPQHTVRSTPSDESIKPIAPLKATKKNKSLDLTTNQPVESPPRSPNSHHSSQNLTFDTSHPRNESPIYDPEPTTPITPTAIPEPLFRPKPTDMSFSYGALDLEREDSHFSWTTYTSSATESPCSITQIVREASPPPMQVAPPPITIRKRPVATSPPTNSVPFMHQIYTNSTPSVISRKPVPTFGSRSASSITPTSRAASTSKSLPPTPTVMEAADKIENLDAQLESLNRRKHNILRIIRDLEGSLVKNAITYNMWKRREVEKSITNHKLELDDIGSDVYEISLRLHRTQRKRDREVGYEACTGLWIKRVTS